MAPPSTQKPLLQDEKEHSLTQGDVDDETWTRMPIRERFGWYYERCSRENFTLPVFTLFAFYVLVGLVWYAGWYYIGMDHSKAVFDPWNARRFVCYNILHGITGLGSTCGPLGGKVKVPFFACFLTFLTPGSLASPLFPGFVRFFQKIPARRGVLGIIAFAAFYASMVQAMLDPTPLKVTYAVAALGMASTFDTVIFFAARGEHYGYHMIYLMWPDWIAGMQWSQLAMYFFVGVSKVGPWFKYVVLVLVKDALFTPFLPKHTLAKLFYKDWPRDHSPSCVPKFLQLLGYLLEWGFPACMVVGLPGSNLNNVGVWGMVVYHFFIWITLPMASVFEWQYYCVYINMFCFGHNELAMPTSPSLIAFLLFTGVFLPIVGQIWPLTVPFLMAYRQYAGNWRTGTWFVRHDAAHKLEKMKSYNKVLWYTEAPKELGGLRADFMLTAPFFEVAHFRGMISMQEKFLEERGAKADDYYSVGTFHLANALFGWDLAVGWLLSRDCVVEAVAAMCDFQPGELYCMYILPAGILPPHTTGYHLFDVTKGPRDAEMYVQMPYKELEGTHPIEVQVDFSKMKAGNSINGTILDTWY